MSASPGFAAAPLGGHVPDEETSRVHNLVQRRGQIKYKR